MAASWVVPPMSVNAVVNSGGQANRWMSRTSAAPAGGDATTPTTSTDPNPRAARRARSPALMCDMEAGRYSSTLAPVDRVDPPNVGDERTVLQAFLDWHRATLLTKCDGLDADQLRARPVPTSLMSLHGLVRHMAEVERGWFQRTIAGADAAPIYYDESTNPEGDFEIPEGTRFDDDVAVWRAEVARSDEIAAAHDLDDTGIRPRTGEAHSLRWVLVHMIEEYARHNGHADLFRELLDGAVGE